MRDRLVLSLMKVSKHWYVTWFGTNRTTIVCATLRSIVLLWPLLDAIVDSSSACASSGASPAEKTAGEGNGHARQADRAQAGGKPTEQICARGGTVGNWDKGRSRTDLKDCILSIENCSVFEDENVKWENVVIELKRQITNLISSSGAALREAQADHVHGKGKSVNFPDNDSRVFVRL